MKKRVWPILLIIWIAFIFFNSLQTGDTSSDFSGFFTTLFQKMLSFFGIEASVDTLSLLIRKGAHMFEFFVLALLFCINYLARYPLKSTIEKALVSAIAVAITDEILQLFVNGRAGTIIDVAIDNVGTVFGLLLFYIILRNKQKKPRTPLNNN
ncbi:MAG: VanZ family protein [Bacilli bacterium]